jgi:hypothetical protein
VFTIYTIEWNPVAGSDHNTPTGFEMAGVADNEILERINEVFQDVFEDDELQISNETTAADVEGWDSLMHVTLLMKVEKN